ncbi:MAG: RNA polymerase sigma factor [Oscillospiraceae bacterium]|nr:RNA polymerase sigma factor [Oscillospiraceae bacterium]
MAMTLSQSAAPSGKSEITGLIDEHSTVLYRFCRSITYSKEDAEDLFQETWIIVLQKPLKIDIAKSPQSFLCREALSLWKSKQRKYARRMRIAPQTPLDFDISSGQNVEDDFLKQAEKEFVQGLVDKLPEKYRIPIILHYNAQMDIADIARTLNLPPGTVKSRLFNARQKIRKGVDKYEKD